jgi:hypothetical protein
VVGSVRVLRVFLLFDIEDRSLQISVQHGLAGCALCTALHMMASSSTVNRFLWRLLRGGDRYHVHRWKHSFAL